MDVNRNQQKLAVTGYVDANKVLKKVKGTGKCTEFWPYVPYNLVYYPYTSQAFLIKSRVHVKFPAIAQIIKDFLFHVIFSINSLFIKVE